MTGNAAVIAATMKAQGAPDSFISAALGNSAIESGIDPQKPQDGGGPGFGLFQWETDRQNLFKKVEGVDIHKATLGQETDFFLREMKNKYPATYGQLMSGKLDVQQATKLLMHDYLIPKDRDDPTGSVLKRTAAAQQFAQILARPELEAVAESSNNIPRGTDTAPLTGSAAHGDKEPDDTRRPVFGESIDPAAGERFGNEGPHILEIHLSTDANSKATVRQRSGQGIVKTVTAMPTSGSS